MENETNVDTIAFIKNKTVALTKYLECVEGSFAIGLTEKELLPQLEEVVKSLQNMFNLAKPLYDHGFEMVGKERTQKQEMTQQIQQLNAEIENLKREREEIPKTTKTKKKKKAGLSSLIK